MHDIDPKKTRGLAPLTPVADAQALMMARLSALGAETVALSDAVGRVLAEDATADLDQPAFDRAMMDGFAVRAEDCSEAGAILTGIGASPAGEPFIEPVKPGTCVRVMTGGVVPPGATAVIPVEDCEAIDGSAHDIEGSRWRFLCATTPEKHIARQGAEVAAGDVILAAGSVLTSARIGALGAFGHAAVAVRRRPSVAILPTGSEIVAVDRTPQLGQVRNSNSHMLTAMVSRAGAMPVSLPPIADSLADLVAAIRDAVAGHDILVMSGGVSMGDYDLVGRALSDLGAAVRFNRIRLRPGKPQLCAVLAGTVIHGTPGNPVSSYACATLFLRPAIAAMLGATRASWASLRLPLTTALAPAGKRDRIHPAAITTVDGGLAVCPIRTAGSADLPHFAAHDALIRQDAGEPERAIGDRVEVLWWPEGL